MIVAHKYLHKKQKTITRNSRNREKQKKTIHPASRKPEKAAWAKKRVSRWTENPKGWSRKKLGIEAYHYVSLDHLATRLRYRLSSSDDTNQSDQPSTK